MPPVTRLLVFSSTPDVAAENFVVPQLAEAHDWLFIRARELGYDGLEYLPNPNAIPAAEDMLKAASSGGSR